MRKIIIAALTIFALLSCDVGIGGGGSGASTEVQDNRIPADFLGLVHAGQITAGKPSFADQEYEFIGQLGAKWLLRTFNWNDIETADDVWDFDGTAGGFNHDRFVDEAYNRGYKVFAVLAYENNAVTGDSGRYISPANYPKFARFVTKTIERYGEKIGGYSIWNEPNENPRFWTGQPAEIIQLSLYAANAARQAINQYNPKGQLLVGVLNSLAIDDWTEGFFANDTARGAMLLTDGMAYHPYMPGGQRAADLFTSYQNLVSRYGFDKKIWITEVGYPTGGRYVSRVAEDRMPEEVIKTITLLAARGARHVFWYQLFDTGTRSPDDSEDWFGLAYYNSTGDVITEKKGLRAYALCGANIPGSLYRPDLPAGSVSDVQAYCFQRGDTSSLILWADLLDADGTKTVTVTLPGSDQTEYNIDTGAGTGISGTATYALGRTPVFLTWKPAAGSSPSISAP
jgi:hypothetical protein